MEVRFAQWLKKENLLGKSDKILLAVSGGADSMALLRLMLGQKLNVTVAHCNFGLRGDESDEDEAFVRKTCADLNTPIHVAKLDAADYANKEKCSIQEAARSLRYDWFRSLMEAHGFTVLCTAHHGTDHVETVLMNLLRGSGMVGITGIRHQPSMRIVRPLLPFTGAEIRAWMDKQAYAYRNDSSNDSDKYTRNYLRKHVLPALHDLQPDLEKAIQRTSAYVGEQAAFFKHMAQQVFDQVASVNKAGHVTIDLAQLEGIPQAHLVLEHGLISFGFNRVECKQMLTMQSGSSIQSPTHTATKDRTHLAVQPRVITPNIADSLNISAPGTFAFSDYTIEVATFKLDALPTRHKRSELILKGSVEDCGLKLRQWAEGDRIQPFGMKGSKLISDVFIDNKVSVLDKHRIPMVLSNETLVWVPNLVKAETTRLHQRDIGPDTIATRITISD